MGKHKSKSACKNCTGNSEAQLKQAILNQQNGIGASQMVQPSVAKSYAAAQPPNVYETRMAAVYGRR